MAAAQSGSQSTAAEDGTLAVSSLGSTNEVPGSVAGSVVGPLGSLGSLDPADPADPAEYSNYVALGDSYAAFGDQAGLDPTVDPCMRSDTNYPSALAELAELGEFTDVSCGGAVISHLSEEQYAGVAPQLDALGAETDLVTLSIGGNDVGFGAIVNCITDHIEVGGPPTDCREKLGDEVEASIEETFGEGGAIDDVYDAIAESAPNANIIATQYLPLMPANDDDGCAFTEFVGPENLEWSREITEAINVAVDEAAQRNGHVSALAVDGDGIDRSGCADADVRWTDFAGGPPTNAFAFHPTALGQAAMADAIATEL